MKLRFLLIVVLAFAPSVWADLMEIETKFRAEYEESIGKAYAAAVSDLETKYAGAVERSRQQAAQAGRLDEALALREELKRLEYKEPLPENDEGVAPAVSKFRVAFREQVGKLKAQRNKAAAPLVAKFEAALSSEQETMTKADKLDEAQAIRAYLAQGAAEKLLRESLNPSRAGTSAKGKMTASSVSMTSKDVPFENHLGMRFVPVPITGGPSSGKKVLFSIWETRVEDYSRFVEETGVDWVKPEFKQGDDHPVVMVSWDDASSFCRWLTEVSRKKRKIGPKDTYRLPSDHEWSCAVGIGSSENPANPPVTKNWKGDAFPWGEGFPPPPRAGNFYGEETKGNPESGRVPITGYDDGFDRTAPVGSFGSNSEGLFDLGGNAEEFCLDEYDPATPGTRVLRGGAWAAFGRASLLSSSRGRAKAETRYFSFGFRVVLEIGTPAPQP